jgi:hypothetical protein
MAFSGLPNWRPESAASNLAGPVRRRQPYLTAAFDMHAHAAPLACPFYKE